MGVISVGDLVLLRDRKDSQYSVERLYGFGFPPMWKGRVNDGSIARGDQTIVADTGAMEAGFIFANIVTDLLMFVGSAEGLDDKGRRRILSVSGTAAAPTFIVDWNDSVDWSNNDFLTVINFFPPWPRFSWFTSVGPIFTKDGPNAAAGGAGEIYTDQNEEPPPLVIMAGNFAGELSGGTLAVQLSAVNSQVVADGASISSYAWAAVPTAGASFDNAAIAAPVLTFSADNSKYQISCVVTDDNGKTAIGHRCYIIGGAITEFSRGPITETYDTPSVNATITLNSPETTDSDAIRPVMTWADFVDKTLVIITSEDQYGSTQKAISFRDAAQYEDHLHILYVGYLFAENDDLVDDGSGTVTLNVVSTIPMFLYSISLTGVETPADWYEMDKTLMTVAGNLFHLFKYQSTLLEIMDWHLPWGDTVKRSANEEFNEGSLLDRARALAGARLMAITAVGLGEVWVETDLNLRDSTDRTAETTTLTLVEAATGTDISGTKRARVRQYGDNIRALVDGGSSTGLLGSFTPFLSASQFIARAEGRPQMVNFSRLMLPDQTEANRLAGRIATVANGKYQEVNLEFAGNYRGVFSPGDQQKIDLGDVFAATLQANIRGYTDLEDADVIVRSMTHSHTNGYTSVSIVADIMPVEALTGVTITPPSVPPDAIEPGSGDTPSFDEPPPPVYPPVPPDLAVAGAAVGIDEDDGVYWTLDSGSTWEERNNGLSPAGSWGIIWDPWWFTAFGNNSSNPEDVILWWSGEGFIRRSVDAGKNWDDFTQFIDNPPNSWDDSPVPTTADVIFRTMHGDIHSNGTFNCIVEWEPAANDWRRWMLKTDDNGSNWSWSTVTTTAWTWNDDFANSPNIFYPDDPLGFGDLATYTFSTGFVSIDGQSNVGSFSRIIEIVTPEFTPTEINTVTINFDLTLGAFHNGAFVCYSIVADRSGGGSVTASVDFNTAISGAGQTLVLNVNQTDIKRITILIRSSNQVTAVFSGALALNSVTVTGAAGETPGENTNPFEAAGKGRPLGLDVDLENGSKIWQTAWETDSFLLVEYSSSLAFQSVHIFAPDNVTEAQVDARTFYLVPYCPPFFGTADLKDIVYVFGRWDDGTVRHISKSVDAGATFTDIGDSATWGADWVGGFFADDASTLYAFVNGASPQLYRSLNGGTLWTSLSVMPFEVDPDGVSKHPDGRILIANRINGAQMAAYADSAYAAWTNATGSPSFPTGGAGARSIIWIT